MTTHAWLLLGAYLAILLLVAKPLGIYIANVMEGRGLALRLGGPIESKWAG
jgi:K+-transporting ATPase ATPase A chain